MPATADPLFVPGLPDFAPQRPTYTGGNFPFTPVLDDFTRGSVGANWTTPWLGTTGTLTITSNRLTASGASAAGAWNPQAFGPDCEVYVDLPTLPDAGTQVFLDLRRQTLNNILTDGYELRITPSTGEYRIRKLVSGANTVLLIVTGPPLSAGDSIGFRAVGNTLTAWHAPAGTADWIPAGSVDDSTFPNVIGYIGLQTNSTGSPAWDNFGGGSLSPVIVLTPPPTSGLSDPILLPTGPSLYPSQQPYFPPIISGDITISPSVGALLLLADASTVAEAVTPTVGNLVLSATASTVSEAVTPTVGNLILGAVASTPAVAVPETVGNLILGAGTSSVTITGDITVNPSVGNLSLTGGSNVVQIQTTPTIGNLVLTAAASTTAEQVTPSVGNLVLSGPSSPASVAVSPTIGNLALGAPVSTLSLSVSPPVGVLSLTGGANTTTGGISSTAADLDAQLWLFFLN